MRSQRSLLVVLSIGALVLVGVLAFWWVTRNDAILLALLGYVGPIILLLVQRGLSDRDADSTLEAKAAKLAEKVRVYWNDESERRHQRHMERALARWELTEPAKADRLKLPVDGDLNNLIAAYLENPCRLLLLGEAGSGKTVFGMHLTLALLGAETPARVPVLLQLASWDRQTDLGAWMIDQLQTLHGIDRGSARMLLEAGRLLPILDGADEGLDSSVPFTLSKLDGSKALRGPFVVTCRQNDFDPRRDPLDRDADVRILPLQAEAVADALARASGGQQRWTPVIEEIRTNPAGVLAEALSTNLTLFLMLQVHRGSDETPADLINERDYPTVHHIRDRLIDLFLARAFRDIPRYRDLPAGRLNVWLTFTAARLRNETDKRLSWWQFYRVFGAGWFAFTRAVVGALAIGALCLVLFGLFGKPLLGAFFGAALGAFGGLALGIPKPAEPRTLPFALRSNKEDNKPAITLGFVSGIGAMITIGLVQQSLVLGLSCGLVIGPGFAAVRWILGRTTSRTTGILGPEEVLRDDRRTVLTSFVLGGLICGCVGAGIGSLGGAHLLGFIFPLAGRAEEVLAGAAIGAFMGSFGLAVMVHATGAWGRLVLIRFLLAARGQMPLRVMSFLRDCERVGVLRRLGPQYEFRNELFRSRLEALAKSR